MLEKSLEVLKVIQSKGFQAYLVGGFVRDYILNKESLDVDICTSATPKDLKEIFNNINIPEERYGSITLHYKKVRFEITTFRIDLNYINNRYPSEIAYTDDLLLDLKRRDFTMNTICMDSEGKVIDLLNNVEDIKNKVISTVAEPNITLSNDALRILRAIRFSTTLDFKIDKNLSKAIIKNKKLVKNLSFFRKKEELSKIFSSPNVKKGILLLKNYKMTKILELKNLKNIKITSDIMGIWVQVGPSKKYPFTSTEKKALIELEELIKGKSLTPKQLYKYGPYICSIAGEILGVSKEKIYEIYEGLTIYNKKDIKINIEEIIKILNLEKKALLKTIIRDLEQLIISKTLDNDEEKIKEYIIKKYSNMI